MKLKGAGLVLSGLYLHCGVELCGQAREFKSYKTQEAYCQDNPKMPTCIKMKPLPMEAINPTYRPAPRRVSPTPVTITAAPSMIVLGEPDWRFAHPHADLLGGMNITSLIGSPIIHMLLKEAADKGGLSAADVESGISRAGDIEKISLSVRGKDILLLMTGKLDSIERMATPGGGMSFHQVSADSILLGTEPSLSEAMHRLASPQRPVGMQPQKAKDLAQTSDFWLMGTPALLAAFGTQARTTDVRDFAVSLQLRNQLRMELVLNAPTPAVAQRMVASFRPNDATRPAVGQVSTSLDGTAVHMIYTMQESEARQGMQEFLSGPQGKQMAALIAAGKQTMGDAPQKPSDHPGKVVIYGLEGGPKEVPVTNR